MTKRSYELGSRAEAMAATRQRIFDAADQLFTARWYDEVTLAQVARTAGVSTQTVVNHFGSKAQLYLAAVAERVAPRINEIRSKAVPGDLGSIVDVVCEHYEELGDGSVKLITTAARSTELADVVESGRTAHAAWVSQMFAPWLDGMTATERRRLLVVATVVLDATTWHSLRRLEGLSSRETAQALRDLLVPLLRGRTGARVA